MDYWFEITLLFLLVVLFIAPGIQNLYRAWFSQPVETEDEQNLVP